MIKQSFSTVILDECHYINNRTAARSKAITGYSQKRKGPDGKIRRHHIDGIAEKVKHVIALSGTPITNRPVEIFTTIHLIKKMAWPSFWKFAHRYCGATHNGFGWDFNGASKVQELHEKLTKTVMIRRKKEDVLTDLPPKMRNVIPMEITNDSEYQKAEADLITWIHRNKGRKAAEKAQKAEQLARFENLKQICWEGKKKATVSWIADFLETGKKLVVFSTHTKVLDCLEQEFSNTVRVDGSVSGTNRQKAVESFQDNPNVKLFLGNIKAAGVGLTLTSASDTCFLELDWVPGNHLQAEDRVHRIGQKSDSVNAYYLLASGTIEEEIMGLLEEKAKVLDAVLDGIDVESGSIFNDLLKKLENE